MIKHSRLKQLIPAAAVIIFATWVGKDLFSHEFFQSHDGFFHVLRLSEFHQSLFDGQFPVRWAPNLLSGLGYPLFIINYHLPYYLAELFYIFGFSLFSSIKAVFLISLIGGALTSFSLFKTLTKNIAAALTGSIFFTVAPYRLANIFERGALGEAIAYLFLPLLFLGAHTLYQKKSSALLIFALTGLILSHTVIFITAFPFLLLYIFVIFPKSTQTIFKLLKPLFISFALSSFQLFPAIFERTLMKFDAQLLSSYLGHFKSIYQLLRIPHPDINIGTRFQIGFSHTLVLAIGIIVAIKGNDKSTKTKLATYATISLISLFLILSPSKILWDLLVPLKFVLYPWRFLGIIAFSTAAIASILVSQINHFQKLSAAALIALALFTSRHYTKIDIPTKASFPSHLLSGNATTQNEFDPQGFNSKSINFSKPQLQVISGNIKTISSQKRPTSTLINTQSKASSKLKVPLLYFPGWQATLDGTPVSINSQEKNLEGFMVFNIPPGSHQLQIKFSETPIRKLGNIISATTLALIAFAILKKHALRF